MSTDKTPNRRKAGQPVRREPEPRLRLLEPTSECSTTGLIAELSEEVRELLRGRKRRQEDPADGEPPEAA